MSSSTAEAASVEAPASDLLCTLYHQATPATTYWRVKLPAKYLPGGIHEAHRLEAVAEGDGFRFPDLHGGVAIMQFPGDQGTALCLMALQAMGHRFLVEVDDNYLDASDPLWHARAGWGMRIGEAPHTRDGHRWITAHADGVIVTTPALADIYRSANENVTIARNSIDPDDWPELKKPDDGVFRIGWYASGSHDRDQAMCRKAISWASRQPGVEIVNIGLNPTGWDFPRVWHPWRDDFLAHREVLMQLDVGISPLIGTPMTKYRSDVKALEYAMGAAFPILQAYAPYDEWRDKPYARVCWTEDDWVDVIRWAVRNRDEVRERGLLAREYVLRERTFRTEVEKWRSAVGREVA